MVEAGKRKALKGRPPKLGKADEHNLNAKDLMNPDIMTAADEMTSIGTFTGWWSHKARSQSASSEFGL